MTTEINEASIGAAARAAEAERIVWPHYCRKIRMSVTRESCLDKYRVAHAMDFGPCKTCVTGRGLALEHAVKNKGRLPAKPAAPKEEPVRQETPKAVAKPKAKPTSKPKPKEPVVSQEEREALVGDGPDFAEMHAEALGFRLQSSMPPGMTQSEPDPFAECAFQDVLNYSRPKSPAMTMYPKGDIGLNKDAAEAMAPATLCKLFYDAKTGVLGIKPLEQHEPGALSIAPNTKSGNARISGALLCKTFGITARPKATPLVWSQTHGMWCARLPKEGK